MTRRKYHAEIDIRRPVVECEDEECGLGHTYRPDGKRTHLGPRQTFRRYVSEWEPVP